MSKKQELWVVKNSHNKTIAGPFADKRQAKVERDRIGGVAKGFKVSPGNDHWRNNGNRL